MEESPEILKVTADDKRGLKQSEPLPIDLPMDIIIELECCGFSSWKKQI